MRTLRAVAAQSLNYLLACAVGAIAVSVAVIVWMWVETGTWGVAGEAGPIQPLFSIGILASLPVALAGAPFAIPLNLAFRRRGVTGAWAFRAGGAAVAVVATLVYNLATIGFQDWDFSSLDFFLPMAVLGGVVAGDVFRRLSGV